MPFIPHTDEDIAEMLAAIGVKSIEDLFDEIPTNLRSKLLNAIPEGMTEMEMSKILSTKAENDSHVLNFIGAGAYEHHIPAAVWALTSRGEFMTAYTPYQAEASQGTLQLVYEYQTMMASLTGMDVSNASLYDGASALAESILMAVRANKNAKSKRVLIAGTVNPYYRKVVNTIVRHQKIEMIEIPYSVTEGRIDIASLKTYVQQKENNSSEDFAALVIASPNFFGVLEEVDALTNWAHQHNALVVASVNPTSLALFKEPGQWGDEGADIVCGEGQPLGVPLASGGPYFGFMCCKMEFVRQMPGRIIGRTVDVDGNVGFALTLQAREQHIRRSKATSNICTNQGLLVTAATIYLSLLGAEGLRQVAAASYANTRELVKLLTSIEGVELVFHQPHFHEVVLRFSKSVQEILSRLAEHRIQGGFALTEVYPELGECLLVCATETKTHQELLAYYDALKTVMQIQESDRNLNFSQMNEPSESCFVEGLI